MPSPTPSPAAVRLKNARSAYSRLARAVRDPNLDWFRRSLNNMLANPPSKTCALHNWPEQIAGQLLWQRDATQEEKLVMLLAAAPTLENLDHLVSRCIRLSLHDCAVILIGHGGKVDLEEEQVCTGLIMDLARGRWPRLDEIAPQLMDMDQEVWLNRETYRLISRHAFVEEYYTRGGGLFSSEMAAHLVRLSKTHDCHESVARFCKSVLIRYQAPAPTVDLPWAPGMAVLLNAGLFSREDFASHAMFGNLGEVVMSHADHLALGASLPVSCTPTPRPKRL